MATTKERLDLLTRHQPQPNDHTARMLEGDLVAAPRVAAAIHRPAPAVLRTPIGVRLLEPISARWAVIGAVAWVVLLAVGIAVEPPPTNPAAVDPWFVSALGTLLLGALLTTLAGLGLRRRWSLAASLVAAGLLVVSTVMCPVSGTTPASAAGGSSSSAAPWDWWRPASWHGVGLRHRRRADRPD